MTQKLVNRESKKIIRLFRSPTLNTIKMVEKTIEKYNGEFKKTQIWEKLPKKVMWDTYLTILNYLEEVNHIIISENAIITYIWNPKLTKKMFSRKSY